MLKKTVLAAAMAFVSSPSFAALSDCSEPYPPAAVDGSTASEEKMAAARKDVMTFISDSDNYQVCLNSQLVQMKQEAAKSKDKTPVDPSVQANVAAKLDANQKMKERVGAEYNAAVTAYNAKHPKTP